MLSWIGKVRATFKEARANWMKIKSDVKANKGLYNISAIIPFTSTMYRSICLTLSLFSILLLAGNKGLAQNNLDYYLEQAAIRNATLRDFKFRQDISELEIQKIKTQYEKPQWALTGDYLLAPFFFNRGRVIALTPNPDVKAIGYDAGVTNGGLYSAQVNVNYPLFTKKLSQPLFQQQQLAQLTVGNQSRQFKVDLTRLITNDYLNAYLLQQQMDFMETASSLLLEQRELVRKLADRGIMRVTDLQLLNLEIQNQNLLRNNLEAQYRQALGTLNSDVGILDTTLVRLDSIILFVQDPEVNSLFLETYRLDSLAAVNDQEVFATRYLPQVSVFANGGLNAVEINNIYRKVGVSAGIRVSWLLGDGGQGSINAQQNKLRQLNARTQAQFTNQQIQNNRQNNALVLRQSRQNIQLLETQLDNYQRLLTAYRQEFALGQLSVIDYLNVMRTYVSLQQQKVQMETQLLLIINEINYWNN